jgi:recombination associated protein RdgC
MPYSKGRLTFCRFSVTGDAPTSADETAIAILNEHGFKETEIGAPDEVEAGFVTAEHILDTHFTYEKNGYGDALLFGLRIDTHKVPSDLKQAYRKINEQAAAAGNPSGFASKADKRDAKDEAERQVREDLASGKFRRSKMIEILWDLPSQTLYVAATGSTVLEQLAKLMKSAFAVDVQYQSAGTLAGRLMRGVGKGRDYEDLRPTAFTPPPAGATDEKDDADSGENYIEGPRDMNTPMVPWIVKSVDLKDFLGNEFLFWLWWITETREGTLDMTDEHGNKHEVFLAIDKMLDMDCAWDAGGKQTLRGAGPTRLIEAGDALVTGKWPRKVGLILSDGEHQWELGLQGDLWAVSAAMLPTPEDGAGDSPREQLEQRLHLSRLLAGTLEGMYRTFLATRTSSQWPTHSSAIRKWITDRLPSRTRQMPVPVTEETAKIPQTAGVAG